MTVLQKMRGQGDDADRSGSHSVEALLADAVTAISALGRVAQSAAASEREDLARAAMRIDEVLAKAVRAIHAEDREG